MFHLLKAAALLLLASSAAADKYIVENDWSGSEMGLVTMIPAAINSTDDFLGYTTVTGNTWRDQGAQRLLRELEFANLTDYPVYNGAVYPLAHLLLTTKPWMLRANPTGGDPFRIQANRGHAQTKAQNESAINFLINSVKKYPNEVTIVAAGTMTNLALAVRMDPTFASSTKKLVIQGGYVDTNLYQAFGSETLGFGAEDVGSDFNFLFDPEAAKIVLNAGFPHIQIVGQVGNDILLTKEIGDRILSRNTTVTTAIKNYYPFFYNIPLWDEVAAAVSVHPELVLESQEIYMDVDIGYTGNYYGRSMVWKSGYQPADAQKVEFVTKVNSTAFYDYLVDAIQSTF
ncbi:inosine-uridine preferring nucleoside hydrolase [Schizosaccharomyces japonicus yFS275]|uniref:Inosine-uridine preferring nucleoside hydrolase n=1 Tax=Schizosaccharomyces japonicus (strain yFS275 / FY16936) TaxID=402676 RepID=B6K850_SCHJY|nr:inosine-uridine preferring nucleoside hydrolase [Schizosaccharomyces japonicus yFS275]EEB09704.2 inosine-uridine preferring nucleoside hydrolase [Schizosaccharomyces japonicus yFS275]